MTVSLTGITWDDIRGYGPLPAVDSAFSAELDQPVEIRWDIQPLSDFESRSIEELAHQYDLLIMDHPHTTAAAEAGLLAPVYEVEDKYVGACLESYQVKGHQWAVPIDAACHVCAYRKKNSWDQPPRFWNEVSQLVELGVRVAMPLKGVHSLMALLTLVASQKVSIAEPRVWLCSKATSCSLELLKQLCSNDLFLGLDWNPIEALHALASGDCDYLPLTFGYSHWQSRAVRFDPIPAWNSSMKPRGVLGGAGIAVSSQCPHRELAIQYALHCGSVRVQTELWPAEGGQPAHVACWDALQRGNPFYRNTRSCIENAILRPQDKWWTSFQSQAGVVINDWLRNSLQSVGQLQLELHRMWLDRAQPTCQQRHVEHIV